MKKIVKYITLLAVTLLATSACDYDDTNFANLTKSIDPNATFYVQFVDAAQSLRTDLTDEGGLIDIETTISVALLGAPQSQDIQVNLSVDPSTTIDANAYTLSSTSITIPAGQTYGSVNFRAIAANMTMNENVKLVLNMDAGANTASVGTKLTYNLFRVCGMTPEGIEGDWTINMWDNYGDGWQGSKITATYDGTSVDIAIGDYWSGAPYYGPDVIVPYTLSIPPGTQKIEFSFTAGDYPSEVEFVILAPNGNQAGAGGPSPTVGPIVIDACVL